MTSPFAIAKQIAPFGRLAAARGLFTMNGYRCVETSHGIGAHERLDAMQDAPDPGGDGA